LTTLVFQHLLGYGDLTYYVSFIASVLLVSLGSDYNVFVVGRIWQAAGRRPLREATADVAPQAASAIAAAGFALALSFALLAIVPLRPVPRTRLRALGRHPARDVRRPLVARPRPDRDLRPSAPLARPALTPPGRRARSAATRAGVASSRAWKGDLDLSPDRQAGQARISRTLAVRRTVTVAPQLQPILGEWISVRTRFVFGSDLLNTARGGLQAPRSRKYQPSRLCRAARRHHTYRTVARASRVPASDTHRVGRRPIAPPRK
jgi:MMPL family